MKSVSTHVWYFISVACYLFLIVVTDSVISVSYTCFQNLSFSHCMNGISSLRMSNMDTHYEIHYSSDWRSNNGRNTTIIQGNQTENHQFSIPEIHNGMYVIVFIFLFHDSSLQTPLWHFEGLLCGFQVGYVI